jgi:uncharacterized protein
MKSLTLAALMSLALLPCASAATFDCAKALTLVEKAICSDKELSAMDDQLGRLYQAALTSATDGAALKTAQKAWLALRDQCRDAACLNKTYADRIAALKQASAPSSPSSPADVTGTYQAKIGDVLVQQTADGRIKFDLNATYRTNVGEVSGEVPLSGYAASYVDKDSDCILSFKFTPGSLVVTQNGSCGMGLNVSGAGTYKRASITPPKFDN